MRRKKPFSVLGDETMMPDDQYIEDMMQDAIEVALAELRKEAGLPPETRLPDTSSLTSAMSRMAIQWLEGELSRSRG